MRGIFVFVNDNIKPHFKKNVIFQNAEKLRLTRGFCPEKGARYNQTLKWKERLKNQRNNFITSDKVDQTQRPLNTLKTDHSSQKRDQFLGRASRGHHIGHRQLVENKSAVNGVDDIYDESNDHWYDNQNQGTLFGCDQTNLVNAKTKVQRTGNWFVGN